MNTIQRVCCAGNLAEIDKYITGDKINLHDQNGSWILLHFF